MKKFKKFLDNYYVLIIVAYAVLLSFWVMPKITKFKIDAEVKYWNCKIISNFSGDIYLCKKNP